MRRYETIFITHPELSEEGLAELKEKLRSIINGLKGDFVKLEDWGLKKLGYAIRKNTRGHYFLLDYLAATELVREIERTLRLNDRVLKFQTVRISSQISPEAAQALKEAALAEGTIKAAERPPLSQEPPREDSEKEVAEEGEEK